MGSFAGHAVVVALAIGAITSARTRGQEPAPTLSGPGFIPDARASTLAGWHTLGQAAWRADQGEIGQRHKRCWLVLDRFSRPRPLTRRLSAAVAAITGVLLRRRPTPGGMQGAFLAIRDGELKGYALTLDRDGNQVQQKELRSAGA